VTKELVVALVPLDLVGPCLGEDVIATRAPPHLVVPAAGTNQVITAPASDLIGAPASDDDVAASRSDNLV
jgi:hypothetical protein